jgi:hypothetical protein
LWIVRVLTDLSPVVRLLRYQLIIMLRFCHGA